VGFGIGGGKPGGVQELVALAQRDGERLAEPEHHVAAGPGASGLQERQVSRGGADLGGEGELADAVMGAQVPEPGAERADRGRLAAHEREVSQHRTARADSVLGNRPRPDPGRRSPHDEVAQ
jgi:hypothetical protein